jgi:hypothetical protein
MLKQLYCLCAIFGAFLSAAAQAAPTLQLDPSDRAVVGAPGTTVGWGFSLTNLENYLVVTSASFEVGTAQGTFTDFISAANFFVVGPASSGSTVWAQPFNDAMQLGIGSFLIDPSVAAGSVVSGQIVLTYDLYSRSPLDDMFNPDTDTLANGNMLTAFASVSAVPEPETWSLMLAGIALLGRRMRRTRA